LPEAAPWFRHDPHRTSNVSQGCTSTLPIWHLGLTLVTASVRQNPWALGAIVMIDGEPIVPPKIKKIKKIN